MIQWLRRALDAWGRLTPNHGLPVRAPQPVPIPVRHTPKR